MHRFETLDSVLDGAVAGTRFVLFLMTLFGVISLFLAALGLYGAISYSVSGRIREFGIRMALGAAPATIQRMVLEKALRLASAGIVVGVAGALLLGSFISGLLYGVEAYDPATLLTLGLLLAGVALLAAWRPARRATRVDPLAALRLD